MDAPDPVHRREALEPEEAVKPLPFVPDGIRTTTRRFGDDLVIGLYGAMDLHFRRWYRAAS